jgi:uncharacterized DUF497 family protein
LRKHGVAFDDPRRFQFSTAVEWLDERMEYGEERVRATGLIDTKLFVLIYTERDSQIRVISLRPLLEKM